MMSRNHRTGHPRLWEVGTRERSCAAQSHLSSRCASCAGCDYVESRSPRCLIEVGVPHAWAPEGNAGGRRLCRRPPGSVSSSADSHLGELVAVEIEDELRAAVGVVGAPVADDGHRALGDGDLLDGKRAAGTDELLVTPGLDLLAAGERATPVVDCPVGSERVEEGLLVVGVHTLKGRGTRFGDGLVCHFRTPSPYSFSGCGVTAVGEDRLPRDPPTLGGEESDERGDVLDLGELVTHGLRLVEL